MLIPEPLQFGIALVMWAGVLARLRMLLRSHLEATYRNYCVGLPFALATLTLNLPGIYSGLGTLLGVPNVAYLASLCSLVIGAFLMLPFYERLADVSHDRKPAHDPKPKHRNAIALIGALLSMAFTFSFVRAPDNVPTFMFLDPDAPFVAEFLFVSLAWLTAAFIVPLIRLHWRYRLVGSTFSMRLGWGRLAPAGFIVGAGSHLHALLYSLSARVDAPYPLAGVAVPTYYLLAFGTFCLVATGVWMPTWGPRVGLETLYWRARRFILFRRLHPLWLSLYEATPDIALLPARSQLSGDLAAVGDIDFHLNRRVVEIRDGILRLLPFADARVIEAASIACREVGVPHSERPFVVSASALVVAAQAKSRGARSARPSQIPIPDADDVDQEASTLAHLARYQFGCATVAQILTRLEVALTRGAFHGSQPDPAAPDPREPSRLADCDRSGSRIND
jgi:hypothetical protein